MTNKADIYEAIAQARIDRERTSQIEGIIGGIIFSILGACVLFTIVLWLTR